MAVYLVTGASGFIGSWITQALVESGDTVRALDNFSTGKRENLAGGERTSRFSKSTCTMRIESEGLQGRPRDFSRGCDSFGAPLGQRSTHQPHREY